MCQATRVSKLKNKTMLVNNTLLISVVGLTRSIHSGVVMFLTFIRINFLGSDFGIAAFFCLAKAYVLEGLTKS